ncbi:MAG TPA: prolyl oligopeptidase family serine peptidase [Acidimicrobiales bacterium]|nr:prolyl oligopeptidase family serine peptidase [Acidimicrobiales bacterium]
MRRATRLRLIALAVVVTTLLATAGGGDAQAAEANSGTPGSSCAGHDGGVPFDPPRNGESTTALGPDAPAYYEVGPPTGSFAGAKPKGQMIIIHGGGWHLVGKGATGFERRSADPWRAKGWQSINIDYRACGRSMADVLWFKRRVRLLNPNAVICAEGVSAGGHLALMLAATEGDLACVISLGGPTDLRAIGVQTAYDPRSGTFTNAGPSKVANLAIAAFGDKLSSVNPRRFANSITARLLLATGELDPMIPAVQNSSFASAVRAAHTDAYVDVDVLPNGPAKFIHVGTTTEALADLQRRRDQLVAPLTAKLVPPVLKQL